MTYRWDTAQANATLVGDAGLDEAFVINDGGNLRTQIWHYPGRAECLACHTTTTFGGLALGFNTPQLNRDFNYDGIVDNQIRALNNAGYFSAAVTNQHSLRALAPATNETASLEWRARSYLTANCVGCHGSSATTSFDTRLFTPLAGTRLINGALTNTLGNSSNRVIAPGSLSNSMVLTRLATLGSGHMPTTNSTVIDPVAVDLLSRWITNDLPAYRSFPDWQFQFFGSTNTPDALAAADPDGDGANNQLEWLTGTSPLLTASVWRDADIQRSGNSVLVGYPRVANRGFEMQWTSNLFDTNSWLFLNTPENRPFFSATNGDLAVPDSISSAPARYYRVRIFEP